MARNFTRELLKAQHEGARIVCSVAPYEGHAVNYAPRTTRDPQPWVLTGSQGLFRYSGRECHAESAADLFEQALAAVRAKWSDYIQFSEGPKLVHGWESFSGRVVEHAILWEEGPEDWALYTRFGEIQDWPLSLFCEPYNSFVLAVCRQD